MPIPYPRHDTNHHDGHYRPASEVQPKLLPLAELSLHGVGHTDGVGLHDGVGLYLVDVDKSVLPPYLFNDGRISLLPYDDTIKSKQRV